MQEIAEEQMKGDGENAQGEDESGIVLVTCKDELTCFQLQECILKGPHKVAVQPLNEASINLQITTPFLLTCQFFCVLVSSVLNASFFEFMKSNKFFAILTCFQ